MNALVSPRPLTDVAKERLSLLSKEILPFGGVAMRSLGMVSNPDPVIAYLSQRGEDTYRIMERSETSISAARQHVDTTILEAGSEVVVGESGSPQAEKLRDFAVDFLKRVPRWTEVQERMLDAVYWGWRPFELLWSPQTARDGEARWFCTAMIEKDPSRFRFTTDRELVLFHTDYRAEPQVLNRPDDWIHWMTCTSGSIDNPYGSAIYQKTWLLWYAKQRFFQLWAQGMERSQGIITVKSTGAGDLTKTYDEAWDEVRTEVQAAIRILRDANVLVSMPGWELGLLSDVKFSEGWQGIVDYCDREMSTSVAGETLSFKEAEFGTRAQGTVHESAGSRVARLRSRKLEGWVNDELFARAFALNFGEVDPSDMPKWRSKLGRSMDMDVAKFILTNGGKLDGNRIAADGNVPLVKEAKPGQLILERQVAPTPAIPPGRPATPPAFGAPKPPTPPDPKKPETPRSPGSRSAEGDESERLAAELDAGAGREVDKAAASAGDLFAARLNSIVDRFLEEHPDPFA